MLVDLAFFCGPTRPFTYSVGPEGAQTVFVLTELVHARSDLYTEVQIWSDVVFISPLDPEILSPDSIRRVINAHSRRYRRPIAESARDFAALLDYLLWCLLHPRKEWVPSVQIDAYWHPLLAHPKIYLALNAALMRVAGIEAKAKRRRTSVGHKLKDSKPVERFRAQLIEMRAGGAAALADQLAASKAAECLGACTSVSVQAA